MGFWSYIGDTISLVVSTAYDTAVSIKDNAYWLATATWDDFKNFMKQTVNNLTEWKNNALEILNSRFVFWLALLIFEAGLLILSYFTLGAIVTLGIFVAGSAIGFGLAWLIDWLLNRTSSNADDGASNEQQADFVAETLKDQAEALMMKGEYEKAKEFYEQAYKSAKSLSIKEGYKQRLQNVEKILNNLEAEKLNKEGWEAFNEGYFSIGKEKFIEALNKCSTDSENWQKFSDDLNQAKAKIFSDEAFKNFNDGKYEEAIEKFKDAAILGDETNYRDIIAECFYELGQHAHHDDNDLGKAKNFYEKAVAECSYGYEGEEKFKESLSEICKEIDDEEAKKIHGLPGAAKQKFRKIALRKTSKFKNEKAFEENVKHAQAEVFNHAANELYSKGEFEKAVDKHRKAIAALPSSKVFVLNDYKNQLSNTLGKIALKHTQDGNLEQAEKFLTMAISESGEKNENMESLKECLENVKNDIKNEAAEQMYKEGLAAFKHSDFQAAYAKISQAFKTCTEDYQNRKSFEANFHRSQAFIFKNEGEEFYDNKKFEEALASFSKALEALPASFENDLAKVKMNLRKCHNDIGIEAWKEKNFEKSVESFQSAMKFSNNSDETKTLNDQILNVKAAVLNQEGEKLCEKEKYEDAIEKFKETLATFVSCGSVMFNSSANEKVYRKNLASAYNQFGHQLSKDLKFEDANKVFSLAIDEAVKGDEENVKKYRQDLKEAEMAFLHRDIEETYKKGLEMLESGQFEGANILFANAEKKCPENYHNKQKITDSKNFSMAQILFNDGSKALEEKNYDDAVKLTSEAFELLPQDKKEEKELFRHKLAKIHEEYAQRLMSQNKFQKALENFQKAFELNPCEALENSAKRAESEVLFEAGMCLMRDNDIAKAAKKFQQAFLVGGNVKKTFEKNPNDDLQSYAKKLVEGEKFGEATEIFELAVKFASDDKVEALSAEINEAKFKFLVQESEKHRKEKSFEKALENLDEAFELSASEETTNKLNAMKSEILEEFSVKLLSEDKFDAAIEKIEENKKLNVVEENFDEQIASVNLAKVLNQFPKLSAEVAVRRLAKALENFQNFDCIDAKEVETVLKIFLAFDAIEQAKKLIDKNAEGSRGKLIEFFNEAKDEKIKQKANVNLSSFGTRKTMKGAKSISGR